MKIGTNYQVPGAKNASPITSIAELCDLTEGPHLHVRTKDGFDCLRITKEDMIGNHTARSTYIDPNTVARRPHSPLKAKKPRR